MGLPVYVQYTIWPKVCRHLTNTYTTVYVTIVWTLLKNVEVFPLKGAVNATVFKDILDFVHSTLWQ